MEFAKGKRIGVFVTYAKPVGFWEGNFDVLVNREDRKFINDYVVKTYGKPLPVPYTKIFKSEDFID